MQRLPTACLPGLSLFACLPAQDPSSSFLPFREGREAKNGRETALPALPALFFPFRGEGKGGKGEGRGWGGGFPCKGEGRCHA